MSGLLVFPHLTRQKPAVASPKDLRSVATGFGAPPGRRLLIHDEAVLAVRQDNAVGLQGVLGGDEAVLDIAADELGVAFERVSVAPAAGELQDQALPGGDALLAFGVGGFAGGRADRTRGAVPAAEHPGGRDTADAAWEGRRREAIALGPGAHPTAGEEDVGEGLAVRLLARDLGVPQAVGPLGEDPLRDHLREGAVDEPR